jgi:hypothetical protein
MEQCILAALKVQGASTWLNAHENWSIIHISQKMKTITQIIHKTEEANNNKKKEQKEEEEELRRGRRTLEKLQEEGRKKDGEEPI